MTNIDSQLHKYIDVVDHGNAFWKPRDLLSRESRDHELKMLRAMLSMPRFVFTEDMIELTEKPEMIESALDMVHAGVFRTPYPNLVVEMPRIRVLDGYVNGLCALWEVEYNKIHALPWMMLKEDGREPDVVCSDMKMFSTLSGTCEADSTYRNEIETRHKQDGVTIMQFVAIANLAITLSVVVLQTLGLRREVVDEPRLSRARVARGKAPITPYTRISIGKVYRRDDGDESDEYVPGKSPRPHWRRGHTRRYHYGAGRAETRVRWIPARMVALAKPPEYKVTK